MRTVSLAPTWRSFANGLFYLSDVDDVNPGLAQDQDSSEMVTNGCDIKAAVMLRCGGVHQGATVLEPDLRPKTTRGMTCRVVAERKPNEC